MAKLTPPRQQPLPKNNPASGQPTERRRWFVLGREPLLSAAEIAAVLPAAKTTYAPPIFLVTADFDPKEIIRRLGGTIKIAEEMAPTLTEKEMLSAIEAELKRVDGKIHFGLSGYPHAGKMTEVKQLATWGLTIKKALKTAGRSARYVDNRGTEALSSAAVLHNGLAERGREFIIIPVSDNQYALGKTAAIQPLEEFSKRDFGRPGRDDTSGMLPPKLAMMMINLASADKNGILLDPFCGSGTILTEAALLGYKNIIGSDITEKAIADTKKNWDWLKMQDSPLPKIFQADIKNITDKIEGKSVDAIVTESYMGKPLRGGEKLEQLQSQAEELANLYVTAFENFAKILKPKGTVIFIIPEFQAGSNLVKINCLDKIIKLGFKQEKFLDKENSLAYQRPGQYVRRVIYKFTIEV